MRYLFDQGPYLLFALLAMTGIFIIVTRGNLLKAMVGLYLFQSSAILFFILMAVVSGGTVPILPEKHASPAMANPLPHAMMLTAIVVGVATLGVGLALLNRLYCENKSLQDSKSNDAC